MLGTLTDKQVETMLHKEIIGRIGCSMDGKIYVIPINFGYDGKCIYAHSKDGLKTKAMRKNQNVCFEVDRLHRTGSWESVIVWGKYEELKSVKDQISAMKIFTKQIAKSIRNEKAFPSHGIARGAGKENDPFKDVVFKIVINEKSGRFEKK